MSGDGHRLYGLACVKPHDPNGLVTTLDAIVNAADIIIPDASIIPEASRVIEDGSFSMYNIRSLYYVCSELSGVLTSDKIRMHPKIHSVLRSRIQRERDAANRLDIRNSDCGLYLGSLTEMGNIPGSTPIAQEHKPIYDEFLAALKSLDKTLRITRKKDPASADVNLQNLAYALTLATVEPDKKHVLLARDTDYSKLFHFLIGLAFSADNHEKFARKLNRPKIQITNCDDRNETQPYLIEESTFGEYSIVGRTFNWRKYGLEEQFSGQEQLIVFVLQLHLGRVVEYLSRPRTETPPKAVAPTADDHREAHHAVAIDPEEVRKALIAYIESRQTAEQEKLLKSIPRADISKYFLDQFRKIEITAGTVEKIDREGGLETTIAGIISLQKKAREFRVNFDRSAADSIGFARKYAGERRQYHEQRMQFYGQIANHKDSQPAPGQQGQRIDAPKIQRTDAPKQKRIDRTNGKKICMKMRHLLVRNKEAPPRDGETLYKWVLMDALGVSGHAFRQLVQRAGIPKSIINLGQGIKTFTFDSKAIDRIGAVWTPPKNWKTETKK